MDRKKIIEQYYKSNMRSAEYDYQILGWESKNAQIKRFDVFLKAFDFNNKKVLDVGCGIGSLYGYMKELGLKIEYTGVDILSKMIEIAKANFPEGNFLNEDVLGKEYVFKGKYDIIVLSGIFNLDMGNNKRFLRNSIKKICDITNEGILLNLLSVNSKEKEDKYFYIHHLETIDLLKDLCVNKSKIGYIDGYLDNDYTIILKKY